MPEAFELIDPLHEVDALIHALWMAAAALDDEPHRRAIRQLAENAGDKLQAVIADCEQMEKGDFQGVG
ncbi:hypothetical protein G6L63_01145 [Agrobacterium vitis]|uniref:Uncharacterized protein n=1 Tax=Agrobacterium vitis TaxID=373 RepID=A0A368NWX6_AGRVI|nr:hypothetical protein [Agrobacterium vitis]KAA3514808.1 hypothetical protein DXM22_13525 [Agrobacterium vitis]KAA3528396.1 hypothetical protein DXT89_10290 [Agrobacterium vitis]MCF1477848.1 hypothetical protein [Agrobacterium vitis]MUZ98091.1 hypothetical protein [Agrobacterium vitis]MVA31007.1 hypothetical protein [Agrobacterium vitis]